MKKKLLFSLVTAIAMMMLCPLSAWADDYTITPLSGTSGYSSSEGYESIFDGNPDTKWCSSWDDDNPVYAIFKVSEKCKLTGYTLIDGEDTNYYYGRHWGSWTIYGANFTSDDDAVYSSTDWKEIQTVAGEQYSDPDVAEDHTYTVDDADGYQYYMIKVTGVGESYYEEVDDYIGVVAEIRESGVQQMADVNLTFTSACSHTNGDGTSAYSTVNYAATCTTDAYSEQTCSLCNRTIKTVDTTHPALGHSFGTDGNCIRCDVSVTLSLDKTSITLINGEEKTLTPNTNAESSQLTWTSSDENVATVDATGKVTAKALGTADVTVTFTGTSISATCHVTVTNVVCMPANDSKDIALAAGESLVIYDDGGADNNYSYNCNGTINLTAPEGYAIKITGACAAEGNDCDELLINGTRYDNDGWDDDNDCPTAVAIDQTTGNNCTIRFYSDGGAEYSGFNLTVTPVPFLSDIAYTAEKQAAGKYNVNFTFVNKYADKTYTVKEGSETVGTVINGATSLTLKGVSMGTHNYTFTDGTNSVSVACAIGGYKMPTTGTTDITLDANESIIIYDDGGVDNNYSDNCNGTIELTCPEGYVIHVTGTCTAEDGRDYLIINSNNVWCCGEYDGDPTDVDYTSQNNTCKIQFTSDASLNYAGFALTATAVPFLANIEYTAEYQTDGTYNVNFTFVNKYADKTYTVKNGTETVGTVTNGATSLTLKGVSRGTHNYTFTDGTNSVLVACVIGVYNMPTTGTTNVSLAANESIEIYDDGGADNDYSGNSNGTIKLTAPDGYAIKITGTCLAAGESDYLSIDGTEYDNSGWNYDPNYDEEFPINVNIDHFVSTNSCTISFCSSGGGHYAGFALTATAVPYSPIITLNSAGYATYSSDVDFVVATDGVKAYTATVSDDKITLTAVGDGEYIPAGTGVILYGDGKKDTDVLFQKPAAADNDITEKTGYANALQPTTTAETAVVDKSTVSGTVWALGSATSFQKYTGTTFIANRAYLVHELSAGAKMNIVFADDVTTGVEEIENGELEIENSAAYNALGQRVSNNAKGFVIKNGKKFYNK